MHATGPRVLAIAVYGFVAACGSTAPSRVGYAGEWSGTTAQGRPIAFTVSADEKVTAITLGYNFESCSGSHTFSDLNLETAPTVICVPGPCPTPVTSYRAFSHGARAADGAMTSINGIFLSMATAQGSIGFTGYPGCGTTLGVGWMAARR